MALPLLICGIRSLLVGYSRGDRRNYAQFLLADEGTKDERVYAMSLAIQQGIERIIERAPEQYLWLHDRWKTRPAGEKRRP